MLWQQKADKYVYGNKYWRRHFCLWPRPTTQGYIAWLTVVERECEYIYKRERHNPFWRLFPWDKTKYFRLTEAQCLKLGIKW